jgi:sugar O-acyltransferase (sialic acid O-acetyltransferase NeuD family)
MSKVIIIGAGGLGKEVLEILHACPNLRNTQVLGFLDGNRALQGKEIAYGVKVIGTIGVPKDIGDGTGYIVAIGNNKSRKSIAGKSRVRFANAIHPSAIVPMYIEEGDIIIGAGAVLTEPSIQIGKHVHIDAGCVVSHDVVLEDYVRLNPGSLIMGECHIGEGAYIGAGAVIRNKVKIGSWTTIGMGSVVLKDVPNGETWIGVPAKPSTSSN